MHPARRCSSALAALLCVSSSSARRGPNAARRVCCPSSSSLSGTAGGGGGGEEGISAGTIIKTQVVKTSSITTRPGPGPGPAAAGAVCPMGSSSSSSSSSRLFGTLAHQSLSSPPLDQHHLYPTPEQEGPDADPDGLAGQADPDQLLRECEQALQKRPARPHRDLVYPGGVGAAGQAHRHNDHDPGPSIRVLQWNILAQALGEGKDGFVRCPLDALNWQERKYLILEEILTYRPDVVCLQEVDHYFDTFQPVMSSLGYHGSFMAKPWSPCLDVARNNGPDGCALFYRRSRFTLLATAHLRLAAMMLPTNQVAIVQTLRCRVTQRQLCVAVTHLKARSGWERLRSAQGADLLQNLRSITSQAAAATARSGSTGGPGAVGSGGVPLIVCGDFNAEPSEDVYRRFSSSPLGLESAYKLLSADGQTEPAYTTWKIRPSGESCSTLDYIWYTQNALRVDTLLDLPSEEDIGPDRLPSYHYPSDHISLLCDISFTQPSSHRLM